MLRFLTGVCIASIFATVDGWINAATPDELRVRIMSAYAWCVGAAQVLGQLLLLQVDGLEVGFITLLAIVFNLAVVLVTMTRTAAPDARPVVAEGVVERTGTFVITSWTGALADLVSGLVVTTLASMLPAVLSARGVAENGVALAIASFYIGRLVLQMPIGALTDRMDKRLLIGLVCALIATVTALGSVMVMGDVAGLSETHGAANRGVFLLLIAVLGGLAMPLFAVGNSLAFARGAGGAPVKIATTLLLFWSAGSVIGPVLVAIVAPFFGIHAMSVVIIFAALPMAAFALLRRSVMAPVELPSSPTPNDVPVSSLALAEAVAVVESEALGHQEAPSE